MLKQIPIDHIAQMRCVKDDKDGLVNDWVLLEVW